MNNVLKRMCELVEENRTFALATVTKVEGSTPRSEGAKMIITESGNSIGTIGGGRVESNVIGDAFKTIRKGKSKTVSYVLEKENEGGIGMPCGGEMEIFIDLIQPKPTLLIIGSGHITESLASLGCMMENISVTILDSNAEKQNFPKKCRVISKSIEEGWADVTITPQIYVVVATRHEQDEEALAKALQSDASYVGLIGSEKRANIVFQNLKKREVTEEQLRNVHSPIGLEIGAETPEQIAVSIMAEIIKSRKLSNSKS